MQTAVLQGKKVLLTNSGNGLGFAIAIAFAQAGARVIIHDRSTAVAAAAAERLSLAVPGNQVLGLGADLSNAQGRHAIKAEAGALDILVIDALAEEAIDFSQLGEHDAQHDRSVLRAQAEQLLQVLVPGTTANGPAQVFLLSLAASGEPGVSRVLHQPSSSHGSALYSATVDDLRLAPVADLMRSEVLRTNGSLADVADQLLRDHRPAGIQRGLATIKGLTGDIIQACAGHA
jgi:NAD(P)-dependent dehydrogenase (short-subunit alcohol dehydrogenase family)